MPLFHLTDNDIQPVVPQSFASLKLSERGDLQRILRSKIGAIAPDCLVLAEEFCEWDEGQRRIDLLALDKSARLVVIELKRTEDAGHADLQALRYAAMVSTMTFDQAVATHQRFLDNSCGRPSAGRSFSAALRAGCFNVPLKQRFLVSRERRPPRGGTTNRDFELGGAGGAMTAGSDWKLVLSLSLRQSARRGRLRRL